MKTTLIAAACLSMIGSVQAQTNVTAYGVVDQYMDFSRAGSNNVSRIQSGGLDGSRLGFRGEEMLGGGLKALFVVEAGFDADTGTSGQGNVLFGRQSFVGLSGNFGQVTLGRQYSMYYDTLVNYGLGGGLAWGNASEYFGDGSMLRIDDSIKYESPNFGGFSFKGLYGMGEDKQPNLTAGTGGNVASVGAQYEQGPISVGLSYSTRQLLSIDSEKWTAFGASYNFGPIKPAILVSDVRDDMNTRRNRIYEISAEIPLTNSSLLLDIGSIRDRTRPNANATSYSVRYDYFMSKRTTLYTGLAYIKADANAMFGINGSTGAGLTGAPGDNSHALIAGIRHRF
jgi:predicted porin